MANEFIIKNGYFSQGSSNITGSLNVTAGITGSLFGTASWAQNAITASFITTAQTASYVLNAVSSSFATSSSFAITASNATGLSTLNQNVIITGSLTLTNDLIVLGSASVQYITSSQLNINDNIISVNTITPSVRFGGLAVIDSGSSPIQSGSLLFDSQNNQWIFVHQSAAGAAVTSSMLLMGPQTFNNVGNETALTANRVPKSSGADLGEHLTDSNIEDTGTLVSIAVADASYSSAIITQPSVIATTVEDSGTGLYSSIYTEPNRISIGLYDAGDIAISSINISQSFVRITGSLDVKSGITGSLFGTASWARNATTASFINVTNTNNASDYYIVGIDSDNGAQNPEQLYNFGTLAYNPDSNTLKVSNGSGTMIGTASYATKAQNGFPYTGSAQITGSLGVTGSLSVSEYDVSVGLYNVVDTSAKRIQVVYPDSSISPVIDWGNETLSSYNYTYSAISATVDWGNKILYTVGAPFGINKESVDWANRYLRYNNNTVATPPISVNWGDGTLNDTTGATALKWNTPGTLTVNASMVLSASVTASSGNSATSDAILQATLLYLSNNF